MLNFRTAYLMAMREQAPKMFNELRRAGAMDAHLDDKAEEARQLYVRLTDGLPTLERAPYILTNPADEAIAREQVYATLITFPPSHTRRDGG